MRNVANARAPMVQPVAQKRESSKTVTRGPSLFEMEYLRQMKEELEAFLRSKNFSTIREFDIAFVGSGYDGHMKVSA